MISNHTVILKIYSTNEMMSMFLRAYSSFVNQNLILKKIMRTSGGGGGGKAVRTFAGKGSKMAENLRTSFMDGPLSKMSPCYYHSSNYCSLVLSR